MVLNKYRVRVDPLMQPVARRLKDVSPDLISWLALVFAGLAGYMYVAAWQYTHHLLLLAFAAIVLSAVFDALDGYIARFTGKASRLGDFLDHVLDRYADALIFGGIAVSGYCHTSVGLVAILGVFFTSYMGTQGQAIGLTRNYGGIMGRADRLALLLLFTLIQWAYVVVVDDPLMVTQEVAGVTYDLTLLEVLMIIIAVLGNVTAIQRGVAAWRDLKRMEADGLLEPPETPQGLVTVETADEVDEADDEGTPDGGEDEEGNDGATGDPGDDPGD